jgi:hypothetical protein
MSYALFKTLVAPSGINASCMFQASLIVSAGGSALEVYTLTNEQLFLTRRLPVQGIIKSLHAASNYLVVEFTGGKIVVLDALLNTLSLHYYHKLHLCTAIDNHVAIAYGDKLALLFLSLKSTTQSYELSLSNVIDAVFLNDYINPTIAIVRARNSYQHF